jgi:hypothetical protein
LTPSNADEPDTHALLNVGRRDFVAKSNDKLGNLLNVDDVFCVFAFSRLDNLGASSNLASLVARAGRTCNGCSSCMRRLSAAKSHRFG